MSANDWTGLFPNATHGQTHSTIIDEQLSHENMDEWGELIRKALVDERDVYLREIEGRDQKRSLEVLTLFIRGTLVDGVLTLDPQAQGITRNDQNERVSLVAVSGF